MKTISLTLLQARISRIDDEIKVASGQIDDLVKRVAELRAKREDVEIAVRVFEEVAADTALSQATSDEAALDAEEDVTGKPPGIPSVPDMIYEALYEATKDGALGLEPSGMTAYIRSRWWPNVPSERISPIAWRMWKRGDLGKEGSLYVLPDDKRSQMSIQRPLFYENLRTLAPREPNQQSEQQESLKETDEKALTIEEQWERRHGRRFPVD